MQEHPALNISSHGLLVNPINSAYSDARLRAAAAVFKRHEFSPKSIWHMLALSSTAVDEISFWLCWPVFVCFLSYITGYSLWVHSHFWSTTLYPFLSSAGAKPRQVHYSPVKTHNSNPLGLAPLSATLKLFWRKARR